MSAAVVVWLCALAVPSDAQSIEPRRSRPFSVTHYDLQLELRLDSRMISGTVAITVMPHADTIEALALDRGSLEIDRVEERGTTRVFDVEGNQLRIALPRGRPGQARILTITYRGSPRSGLVFVP